MPTKRLPSGMIEVEGLGTYKWSWLAAGGAAGPNGAARDGGPSQCPPKCRSLLVDESVYEDGGKRNPGQRQKNRRRQESLRGVARVAREGHQA